MLSLRVAVLTQLTTQIVNESQRLAERLQELQAPVQGQPR